MDWLQKPAIQWSVNQLPPSNNNTNNCPYWNSKLIALLSSLDNNDHAATASNNNNNNRESISYHALLVAAIVLSHRLRQGYLNDDDVSTILPINGDGNNSQRPNVGVSIVVAIPEGPLLPLAILVVHLLNNQPTLGSNTTSIFAVLVPLEPSEGKERLKHQLDDLRPRLVLHLSDMHTDKLNHVIESMSVEQENVVVADKGLVLCGNRPTLLEFGQFVRETIESSTLEELACIRQAIRDCNDDDLIKQKSFLQTLSRMEQRVYHDDDNGTTDSLSTNFDNRISHVVFTSGTTGVPKGCISSIQSLEHYLQAKNEAHEITSESTVLLASALSFDPCLSDILATFATRATLVICPKSTLIQNLSSILQECQVTHVLCTPTLWSMIQNGVQQPPEFPFLQVVALGGEVIPKRIVKAWARSHENAKTQLRLCATYGVTEACVYQTFGEVYRNDDSDSSGGQVVGKALRGNYVRIQTSDDSNVERGEVVLYGKQVDEYSGYLNRDQLSRAKFQRDDTLDCYCYSTGDLGYIDPATKNVHIVGRIEGEDGMVKINGVRVELGEIEHSIVDEALVMQCLAVDREMDNGSKQIHAFCVLSHQGRLEIGLTKSVSSNGNAGVLLTTGPLQLLLRARCTENVRAGVVPSNFVIIERLPLSPTGKRDRRRLPELSDCVALERMTNSPGSKSRTLREYGSSGSTVADAVVDCLNIQPCQRSLLTTSISFGVLGGDSLAATRVVRSLYATHHGVTDSRFLGGEYGVLDGPFAVKHLIRARTMGEYVDWLDSHGACGSIRVDSDANGNAEHADATAGDKRKESAEDTNNDVNNSNAVRLYEALLEAITSEQSLIACALLDHGVDPNLGQHKGRLGKTRSNDRKRVFRSNPLHLACAKGDAILVKKLLEKGCNFTSPDATGSFPIHLAASSTTASSENGSNGSRGVDTDIDTATPTFEQDEDQRRYDCVKSLLDAGAPLTMKNSNKQTVLHCAARSGHCKLLRYLVQCWSSVDDGKVSKKSPFDWADRWFRTPVHWTVLNGRVEALRILLKGGCSPDPPKPKHNRQTSAAIESPLEICERLYDENDTIGIRIRDLLRNASKDRMPY